MNPTSLRLTAPNVLSENEYVGRPTKETRRDLTYGPPLFRIHVNIIRIVPESRKSAKRILIGIGTTVPRPNMAVIMTMEFSMGQSKSHSTIISPSEPPNVRAVLMMGELLPNLNSLSSSLLMKGKSNPSSDHSIVSRVVRFNQPAIQPCHM